MPTRPELLSVDDDLNVDAIFVDRLFVYLNSQSWRVRNIDLAVDRIDSGVCQIHREITCLDWVLANVVRFDSGERGERRAERQMRRERVIHKCYVLFD